MSDHVHDWYARRNNYRHAHEIPGDLYDLPETVEINLRPQWGRVVFWLVYLVSSSACLWWMGGVVARWFTGGA